MNMRSFLLALAITPLLVPIVAEAQQATYGFQVGDKVHAVLGH